MNPVTYERCIYEGGFEGMSPSPKAKFILAEELVTVQRPRAFGRTILKVWAKWSAVKELSVQDSDQGVRIEVTTQKLGPGTIVIPGVESIDIYEQFAQLKGARRFVPPTVCEQLGIESEYVDDVVGEGKDEADVDDEADANDANEIDDVGSTDL